MTQHLKEHLKEPLYGNCLILAPDGQPLCRTNRKKLDWYLERNLADWVADEKCPTIKLRFEPSGRKGAAHPYLTAEKQNRCVCCAGTKQITRHHVVPYGFRKFFPVELKEHMLHDVLPLCVACHERYEDSALELKRELAKRYNISLVGKGGDINKSLFAIRGAGNALYYHSEKMPPARREALTDKLRVYYNQDEITREDMLKATKLNPMAPTAEFIPFGKYVVEQYANDMLGFMIMWRQHFVDHMKPQYLPEFWDVHHQLEV